MNLNPSNKQKALSAFCVKIIVFFFIISTSFTFAQTNVKSNYSDAFIKECIIEVFQDKADALVFNDSSKRLQIIKHFFEKRFEVKYMPQYYGKKFDLLSSIPLNNKYNKNLKLDDTYNSMSFNPLKYRFPLTPKETKMYRIDNTDHIIFIHSLN